MKRLIKIIATPLIAIVLIGVLGIILLKIYRVERDKASAEEVSKIPGIICIGDSLTYGAGGDGMGYPDYLAMDLDMDGYIIPVYNMGVGGESTVTIASRMGAIPMQVEEFTIPEGLESVKISIQNAYNDWPVSPLRQGSQNNNGVNPCVISGVEGNISIMQEDYGSDEYQYYFTRNEVGEEVYVESESQVVTYASTNKDYQNGIFIVFIGANKGYEGIDDLIYQQKAILGLQQKNSDKYLIIGISTGTYEERAKLEEVMLDTYGDKYINVRNLLSDEDILTSAGLVITDIDREQMIQGMIPDCVRSDGTHFNATGYKILEQAIYERIETLGYLDDISDIANGFNNKWRLFHHLEIKLR